MQEIGHIYKITSPSGKVYIGKTANITRRKKQYEKNETQQQPIINNSITKYGWENHLFEIIGVYDVSILSEMEIFHIKENKSFFHDYPERGMNLTLGGDGGHAGGKLSEETKNKMREKREGFRYSDKSKKKMSESAKKYYSGLSMEEKTIRIRKRTSYKHTPEQNKKISESNKGRVVSEETKRKIGDANRSKIHKPLSLDHKKKISIANAGKPNKNKGTSGKWNHTEQSKKNMSAAHKEIWNINDGALRKKVSEKRRGIIFSEEHKKNISLGKKGVKQDPEKTRIKWENVRLRKLQQKNNTPC
jgi:group I intron endonuclease